MFPLLFGTIPTYFVMWGVAALVCIPGGTWLAARRGFPARESAMAVALLALAILIGSKLMYLVEALFFPFSDYVPPLRPGIAPRFSHPGRDPRRFSLSAGRLRLARSTLARVRRHASAGCGACPRLHTE